MPRKPIEEIDENLKPAIVEEASALRWLAATDRKFTMRGLHWYAENAGTYARLPLRARGVVRPEVWELAQWPASAHLAFRSDTTGFAIRMTNSDAAAIAVMPPSANGLMLYMGAGRSARPWASAQPDLALPNFERQLFNQVPAQMRDYRLYLPQYKELKSLELGLSKGARILPPGPLEPVKPVVFYGTSITHGGCTSTAGGDFVSVIGRMLNLDVINLGFAGNGRGEPEVARLISEIDASLFVLDYAANCDPALLRKTLPGFVRILRGQHPDTPILLVSCLCYSQYGFSDEVRDVHEAKRDIMLEFYSAQRKRGERNIHFVDGFGLLPFGSDNALVDGVHPTNAGYATIADRLAPFIEQIVLHAPSKT